MTQVDDLVRREGCRLLFIKNGVKMIEPGALLIITKDYDGLYEGQEVTLIHQQKEGMCLVRLSSIGVKWIPSSIIKLVS